MNRKTLVNIFYISICILLGVFLLSSIYIFDLTGKGGNLGFLRLDLSFPIPVFIILFFVGLICGALAIFLTKTSKLSNIFIISFFVGSITIVIYSFITLYSNIEYLVSERSIHIFGTGSAGYAGDAFFMLYAITFMYILYIFPGYVIGGFIPLMFKKMKQKKKTD
jgi:hypothetical protein